MNAYRNGENNRAVNAPEIRAMLAASYTDEHESTSAMLARAMIYTQDADRKLAEAKSMKAEAERYRAEMQKTALEQTKAVCLQMRDDAEQDRRSAEELREEAEGMWEAARAELDRATKLREEAEQVHMAAEMSAGSCVAACLPRPRARRQASGTRPAAKSTPSLLRGRPRWMRRSAAA